MVVSVCSDMVLATTRRFGKRGKSSSAAGDCLLFTGLSIYSPRSADAAIPRG